MNQIRPLTATYIAILLCLALCLTGVMLITGNPALHAADAIVMIAATACMAIAWLFPIHFAAKTKLYVDTAVSSAAILLLPPAHAAAAVGLGTLLAHGVRQESRDWAQALFNTAQTMLVTLVAALLLALAGWQPIEASFHAPGPLLMLPVVALATYLLNVFLVSTVAALESAAPLVGSFRSALHEDLRIEALSHASLVTTGTLAALVAISEPWAVVLLAVPIVATHATLERQTRLRLEAERARMVSDAGLAEAQRLAHLGSWEWYPASNRWVWSDEAYRLLGLEPGAIAPTHRTIVATVHPADRAKVERVLDEALANLTPFSVEHRLLLPDGAERHVQQRGATRSSEDGPPVFTGTIQDVTQRVRAEQAMQQAARTAQEADRAKTQLLTIASHELRTPLTSIQGFIEMVIGGSAGKINKDQRELLEVAHRNAIQLGVLVNDLLVLARIEAGRLPLRVRPTNINEAVAAAIATLSPLAADKGISLEKRSEHDGIFVSADPDRLNQILFNLIGNAIKFTDKGGVSVEVNGSDQDVTIVVADSGIGIPADVLPYVFEQFRQGSESARRRGGAGLGLAIAKELVELQGGAISVESADGAGATFTVRLPATDRPEVT